MYSLVSTMNDSSFRTTSTTSLMHEVEADYRPVESSVDVLITSKIHNQQKPSPSPAKISEEVYHFGLTDIDSTNCSCITKSTLNCSLQSNNTTNPHTLHSTLPTSARTHRFLCLPSNPTFPRKQKPSRSSNVLPKTQIINYLSS
jgi:hypothetical protein